MLYLLSTLLLVLGLALPVFGQADDRNFNLDRPIVIEEGGRLELAVLGSDATLVCLAEKDLKPGFFQEMYLIDKTEKERWLNRYKNTSVCRAQLTQGRALTKQAFAKVSATAILLIFLVGIVGTAFVLSPKKVEPLKPWTEIVERAN